MIKGGFCCDITLLFYGTALIFLTALIQFSSVQFSDFQSGLSDKNYHKDHSKAKGINSFVRNQFLDVSIRKLYSEVTTSRNFASCENAY